jgi:hypothetical protein
MADVLILVQAGEDELNGERGTPKQLGRITRIN